MFLLQFSQFGPGGDKDLFQIQAVVVVLDPLEKMLKRFAVLSPRRFCQFDSRLGRRLEHFRIAFDRTRVVVVDRLVLPPADVRAPVGRNVFPFIRTGRRVLARVRQAFAVQPPHGVANDQTVDGRSQHGSQFAKPLRLLQPLPFVRVQRLDLRSARPAECFIVAQVDDVVGQRLRIPIGGQASLQIVVQSPQAFAGVVEDAVIVDAALTPKYLLQAAGDLAVMFPSASAGN